MVCLIFFLISLPCLVPKCFVWPKHMEFDAWLNVPSSLLVCANLWEERTNLLIYEGKGKRKKALIFLFGVSAELAASVPLTEIVGKSDYFRFGMRDSLAIEASFLQVILNAYLLVWCSSTPILCASGTARFCIWELFIENKTSFYSHIHDVVDIQFKHENVMLTFSVVKCGWNCVLPQP